MIRITVYHSPRLAEKLDRRKFAIDLNTALSGFSTLPINDYVTGFQQVEGVVVGDGSTDHPRVHVEISTTGKGVGRSARKMVPETLAQLRTHLADSDGTVHISAEYRLNQYGYFAEGRC